MFSQETDELTWVLIVTVPETVLPFAGEVMVTALCAWAGFAVSAHADSVNITKKREVRFRFLRMARWNTMPMTYSPPR
jgi:hypothetical protein